MLTVCIWNACSGKSSEARGQAWLYAIQGQRVGSSKILKDVKR